LEEEATSITSEQIAALRLIHARLKDSKLNWALTGSMSFSLQGVPVSVNDIDIQTDAAGAYEIERCFAEYVQRPVSFSATERIQSHFGHLQINGVTVEIMGGLQKRMPDGQWEQPVDPGRYRRFIQVDGMMIPVLSLEYEQQAYLAMGRVEKARLLEAWITKPKEKVYAYITRQLRDRQELLVFSYVDEPESGTQVPGGSLEPGETPAEGALREVREEAGLTAPSIIRHIGSFEWYCEPHQQMHLRHIYHVDAGQPLPEQWDVTIRSGDEDNGMRLRWRWMDLREATTSLFGEQGQYAVHLLNE
jgi:8-oxo-dGTP pyrophosphatase MutT (NUDIX family)